MLQLLSAPVVRPPENSCRTSHDSLISLRQPVRQYKCGNLEAVEHYEEFDAVLVHRAKMEEKDFVDKTGLWFGPTIRRCEEGVPSRSYQMGHSEHGVR